MSDLMELSEEDKLAFEAMKADAYSGKKEEPAPVEEEAELEAVEKTADDDDDDDDHDSDEALAETEQKKPGFVPHRKLHKEIERRKGLEGELAKEKEERLRLDERLNLIMERFKEPQKTAATAQEQAPVAPKAEDDIFEAFDHTTKRVSTIEEKLEAYTKQQETNARATQVINAAASAEHAFVKEAPDYFDALGHLRTARIRDYQRMYPNASEHQIKQRIGQEELQFAAQALQRGESPAKAVYEWAKERGYTRPEPNPSGETEQERLARKADAQSRSRTLNGGGSGGNPSTASKQRELLNMSDDDFYAMITKNPDELRKVLMS